ncbi:MAG TPA: hypothetical protein VNL94_05745 [Candidatus Binatia bacterium]|nr:hypothetical protein [Candidatus Binatia bacterium]
MTLRVARASVVALALVLGAVPAIAPAPVSAATPSLTIVGATTYDVRPEEGRVAVTSRLTVTNHLENTVTRRYFFRTAVLTVLPGTSNFRLTGPAGQPKVTVGKRTDTYTNLRLDFGANLAAGRSTTLTLTFDITDPGGAPDRPVRISPSLTSFAAWAYATPSTPGATVEVRFPAGYSVSIGRGPLEGPIADGPDHERWQSGPIAAPLEFVADIVADRPRELEETAREVPLAGGAATILLRSWPDDPAWRDRVGALVERALPILEREIGIPWAVEGDLAVEEALVRSTGGYAGLFAPAEGRIEIAYNASDGVVLHELAHAWLNGRLVADRWVAEGFASYYAALTAAELGVDPDSPAPPPETNEGAIPLNEWGPSGTEDPASERYAYATSRDLAEAIAERAGEEALRAVWSKAAGGIAAYQPVTAGPDGSPRLVEGAAPEVAEGPPDWRGLLDLLEEETGADFTDLWGEAVARPADLAVLQERTAARAAYEASVQRAGDWRLPPATRAAMRAWQFDVATDLLRQADAVIAQRDALAREAADAGLTLPGRLRVAFENGPDVEPAAAEARAERAVVDAIVHARATEPRNPGVVEDLVFRLGLIGIEPREYVAAAAAQLAEGELEAAYASALQAEAAWTGAPQAGRSRIVSTLLLLLALLLLAGLIRQQRRRRTQPAAEPGTPAVT